jgi:glutamyl-tRNA synthetase
VIRGDDHVNNTPRQIHIFNALGAKLPHFAHVPMILGPDGQKLSKRHGAVSVMQYHDDGFLPEALLNALARLGWSHGDDELFTMDQFVHWFDLDHISGSPAQFDPEKLAWLNHEYIKRADPARLAAELAPRVAAIGGVTDGGPPLATVVALLRDRARTLNELAEAAMLFYGQGAPDAGQVAAHLRPELRPALADLRGALAGLPAWDAAGIGAAVKAVLERHKLKMPQLAMPVRAAVFGQTQTPSLDQVLAIAGRDRVLQRLDAALA